MFPAFVHGYILAFGLILPVGPQNAFVFTQGADQVRLLRALPVAIVAALSDTCLILIAVLGVSVTVATLAWLKTVLIVVGMVFLVVIGWVTWRTNDASEGQIDKAKAWPLRRQIVFALSVSLLNPHAILDTTGVIGLSALSYTGEARIAFTAAVILNSWIWFLMLAVAGRLVGTLEGVRKWLNRLSAIVMWANAIYLGINLFRP